MKKITQKGIFLFSVLSFSQENKMIFDNLVFWKKVASFLAVLFELQALYEKKIFGNTFLKKLFLFLRSLQFAGSLNNLIKRIFMRYGNKRVSSGAGMFLILLLVIFVVSSYILVKLIESGNLPSLEFDNSQKEREEIVDIWIGTLPYPQLGPQIHFRGVKKKGKKDQK